MELSRAIQMNFPHLQTDGENYPPGMLREGLASLVGYLQMGAIAVTIFGSNIWPMLGIPEPAWFGTVKDNKITVVMMSFFFCNTVRQSLISTKAFEVYYNGRTVWSAIDKGGVPSIEHLLQLLGKAGADSPASRSM